MLARERTRLVRLLSLTTSPHDGEALAASRMANKLVKRAGETWPNLIVKPTGLETPRDFTDTTEEDEPLTRSATFGEDPFGDGPAFRRVTPMPRTERFIGRARVWLGDMPQPTRYALPGLRISGRPNHGESRGRGSRVCRLHGGKGERTNGRAGAIPESPGEFLPDAISFNRRRLLAKT